MKKLVVALAVAAALGLSSFSAFAQETKPAGGETKPAKKKKHRKHKKHGKKKAEGGETKKPS
jgi:Spy/CpxP family protein refolding chaperone